MFVTEDTAVRTDKGDGRGERLDPAYQVFLERRQAHTRGPRETVVPVEPSAQELHRGWVSL